MRWKSRYTIALAVAGIVLLALPLQFLAIAQERYSKTEKIEWTWETRPAVADSKLPNVLLLGDSITRNYYPEVQKELSGIANVYLMATSASVGDPRLLHQLAEFSKAAPVKFSVVHFNNGLHGWMYSEAEYRDAFPSFLAELRAIAPNASLVWATTTSVEKNVEPGPSNVRIDARNGIAQKLIKSNGIAVDDQHELMEHESGLYLDHVHFNARGAGMQGKQAAQIIRALLFRSNR
jgi:hypothetical protein